MWSEFKQKRMENCTVYGNFIHPLNYGDQSENTRLQFWIFFSRSHSISAHSLTNCFSYAVFFVHVRGHNFIWLLLLLRYFEWICFKYIYTHNNHFICDTQFARARCFAFEIPKDVHTFEINLFVLFVHLEIFFSISYEPISQAHTYNEMKFAYIHSMNHTHTLTHKVKYNLLWDTRTRIVY